MTSKTSQPTVLKGVGLALLGFAIFSLHDAVTKSIDGLSVFQIVFFVVLFSFIPFSVWLAVDSTERSLRPNLPGLVALRCLFNVVGLLCVFAAFKLLPLAEVYSLLFSAPILITLLAIPILGERVRLIRGFAIVMGMIGVLIVLRPFGAILTGGHALALGAAVCVACGAIVTRRIGDREHTVTLLLFPMLTNLLVCGAALFFVYTPMSGELILKCALIGLLSVLGQTCVIGAYRTTEAQFVAPMQYSQMLWALIYGALVFDEEVDRMVLIGSAIIVLSGLLFIWREISASLVKPVLRTRNLRVSGGPQGPSHETDEANSARLRVAANLHRSAASVRASDRDGRSG